VGIKKVAKGMGGAQRRGARRGGGVEWVCALQ
jgi:hypothetical protein